MQDPEMPRVLRPGYRLLAAIVVGTATYLGTPWLPYSGGRVVLAWNTSVGLLLVLIATMMLRTDSEQTFRRAREEETSNLIVILTTILTVAGALVGIFQGLPKTKGMPPAMHAFYSWESVIAVFFAWLLIHTMYALHYAKLYYCEVDSADSKAFRKGLTFPGNSTFVDYLDFVYYSFTIAMCFQTSDVTVTLPRMRRLTIFHAVVSYFFALAILGLLLDAFSSNVT